MKLTIKEREIEELGYTIQENESYHAIISPTGETSIEILELPQTILVGNNKQKEEGSDIEVLVCVVQEKPVALCAHRFSSGSPYTSLVWAD